MIHDTTDQNGPGIIPGVCSILILHPSNTKTCRSLQSERIRRSAKLPATIIYSMVRFHANMFALYSLSPKIDAPKIDAFSENSRNFQNSKIFGELCQNLQFLVKNIFGVTLILYRYRVPTDLCL